MSKTHPTPTTHHVSPSLGDGVPIDVDRLIETRLAAEANSGGGKSWFLRRLLEQTAGHCQQIVIDPEDEFHTLREHADYVLCAPSGGDAVADLKSAALLARRLLTLNVSAIVAIYELGVRRAKFVELFVDALMTSPRDLWHPTMIVVDEASVFCPEGAVVRRDDVPPKGKPITDRPPESAAAIIDLMTRGRKRGFCGILATQRIATLNKSALAECNNIVVGRTGLDVDIARAASILGMKASDAKAILKNLEPGEFFGYGPAISREVIRFRTGPVVTTHPKAGQRAIPPAPPTAKIRAILGKLGDLPAEAAEEMKTVAQLRARVSELEAKPGVTLDAVADIARISKERDAARQVLDDLHARHITMGKAFGHLSKAAHIARETLEKGTLESARLRSVDVGFALAFISKEDSPQTGRQASPRVVSPSQPVTTSKLAGYERRVTDVTAGETAPPTTGDLSKMDRNVLVAIGQYPRGITKALIRLYTGYASSGKLGETFARMIREGWATQAGDELVCTQAGVEKLEQMGSYEQLLAGKALRLSLLAEETMLIRLTPHQGVTNEDLRRV